jgi:hypothetical protein
MSGAVHISHSTEDENRSNAAIDSDPWDLSWPFTADDYESALLVIRSFVADEELYK